MAADTTPAKTAHRLRPHTKLALGLLGAATLAVAAAGVATAHGRAGGPGTGYGPGYGPGDGRGAGMARMFEQVDADGDGRITRTEMTQFRETRFSGADGNGDGTLDLAEFQGLWQEMMRARMVDRFQRLDDDGDGQVTPEEFGRPMDRMHGWLDADEDGAVSRGELREMHRMRGGANGPRHWE